MALRPYWTGTIRVSLVSLSVQMFTAIDAKGRIAFHQVYKPTGERVHEKLFAGDIEVERDELVKGYETEKGEYVLFEPDEIKALKIPSSKTMELVNFVGKDEVDEVYFDTPYYLAPSEKGDLATFVVVRDAMRELKVIGIGQIVIAGSERLCAVKPYGPGLLLETLHYPDDIKEAGAFFDKIKKVDAASDEIELAQQLIKKKTAPFTPEKFHDRFEDALKELVAARVEGRAPKIEEEKPTAKVVNLMDALRASLKDPDDKAKTAATEKTRKPVAKKTGERKKRAS